MVFVCARSKKCCTYGLKNRGGELDLLEWGLRSRERWVNNKKENNNNKNKNNNNDDDNSDGNNNLPWRRELEQKLGVELGGAGCKDGAGMSW